MACTCNGTSIQFVIGLSCPLIEIGKDVLVV